MLLSFLYIAVLYLFWLKVYSRNYTNRAGSGGWGGGASKTEVHTVKIYQKRHLSLLDSGDYSKLVAKENQDVVSSTLCKIEMVNIEAFE